MFTVYVLFSEKHNRLYIGYTTNLIQRFYSHQLLASKGFTIRYRPWKVIHLEYFETKKEAILREAQLKGGQGRQWIREHILPKMIRSGFISVKG